MSAASAGPTNNAEPACRYALRFDRAAQHLVDVEATFVLPEGHAGPLTLQMPAWAPGSYLVRDYARHVEGVVALGQVGEALAVRKVRKDAWEVARGAERRVCVRYSVYGRELTVRTNFVNAELALVQGASSYLAAVGLQHLPHEVEVHLPEGWAQAACGLEGERDGARVRYVAEDFDALVDSPLLLGTLRSQTFAQGGTPHELWTAGGEGVFDDAAAAGEWQRLVAEAQALWGQLPYARYAMLNLVVGGQGGLEHRHSAVVLAAPTARHAPSSRSEYWGLLAHEHFHAWNIKRLRPVALGPFDYRQENYTPSLWVAEGLTAYYDDLLVRRAGLTRDADYLAKLAQTLSVLARTPGQNVQSLTEASFDAWVKLYRPDENTGNSTVSYYLKGSVVGFVLDARLRVASDNARSLDDVMRLAYARYGAGQGFAEHEFREVVSEVAGRDEGAFLHQLLDVAGPVDVSEALKTFGLRLRWKAATAPQDLGGAPSRGALWGVSCEEGSGRLTVARVRRDAPAYAAGLNVGDELLAVGESRLPTSKGWSEAVAAYADGPTAALLVARLGKLRRVAVPLTAPPQEDAVLELDPEANAAQRLAREGWLASRVR